MQAPEVVNMRKETPMDTVAEAAVKDAIAMDVPIQFEMEEHYLKPMFTFKPEKFATCEFSEGCHMAEEADERDQSSAKVEDLVPINAACCTISSCYCVFPQCCGCTCDGTVLCEQGRVTCLKPLDCKDEDKRCCAIFEGQSYLIIPTKFGESKLQCCCCDARTAIPCTDTVPCLVTVMGITCCADFGPKFGCCQPIGQLIPRLKK